MTDRERDGPAGGPFVWLSLAVAAAPLFWELATLNWQTEQGAQGPLILATGAWLLAMRLRSACVERSPGKIAIALAILLPSLLIYVAARMIAMQSAGLLALWGMAVALLYACYGWRVLERLWFPLVYLLFLIPPPAALIDPLVQALKLWIAGMAVDLVTALGVEAASQGSSLFVDQYELFVAAACSGMNSLVSLLAIGIFYVHVRHGDQWRYALLLGLAIVPVALGVNLLRVVILLLAVHEWGGEVLDTPLHLLTGLAMGVAAMAILVGVDVALTPLARAREGARGHG